MSANFVLEDIQNAYRKLKSYVYYDNFFIFLREKIARFEADSTFENNLLLLCNFLNSENDLKSNPYFTSLLNKMDFHAVPKSYEEDKIDEDFIITNKFSKKHFRLKHINYLIDAPIEIHIISLLWVLNEGKALVKSYVKYNYAYALEFDHTNNEIVDGLRLFKPYFEQYQKWRDKAINTAEHFIKDDTDILMISLDVRKYFYNIDLNPHLSDIFDQINLGLNKNSNNILLLSPLLFDIHTKYQAKLPKHINSQKCIPIGLLSSGILGNWFLARLDQVIVDKLSPAYYGRYVDDILIVLSNTTIPDNIDEPKKWIFDNFFIQRDIFIDSQTSNVIDKEDASLVWKTDSNISLQKKKITIYAFDSRESKSVLEKFKKRIEKNSSAFWFLPDETDVENDFDESVYELTYSDTNNKLRSVQGIKQSKYGASVFLAKKIKLSLLTDNEEDKKTTDQILTFFKGRMNLEFSSIWEKALIYFLIKGDRKAYWYFIRETLESINKLEYKQDEKILLKVKKDQGLFLLNCIALSLALNPKFYNEYLRERLSELTYDGWFKFESIKELIDTYRLTNMFRHYFVMQPLLNFGNVVDGTNYINFDLYNYSHFDFDKNKLKYSPRYIYLHEFIHLYSFKSIYKSARTLEQVNHFLSVSNLFFDTKMEFDKPVSKNVVLNEAFETYFEVNHLLRNPHNYDNISATQLEDEKKKLRLAHFESTVKNDRRDHILYEELKINGVAKSSEAPKIALANIIVDQNHIMASMLDRPVVTSERRKLLIDVLNQAEKCNSDILVLPEVSVPYQWLSLISDEARRKQRVIIGGLEHIRINDVCFNLIFTCLPVEKNGIKDVIVVLRLKNHYSPHESKTIRNRSKIVPEPRPATYSKFIWRKIHFSVYNCYELADITHRSLFRSEVDILFASEYNRDINYFSGITDTISRDVHCYFVQVNSADHGDSRITKPSRTETKDILRLKGGKNSVVLFDEVDLKSLREFQSTLVDGQNTMRFKNTPPDFNHVQAEKRLKKE